uniref:Uncharacterized protein n=1 Tax=Anguilla anguilla TaxID=7936 RepID=A0A0E9PL34_ANGAN
MKNSPKPRGVQILLVTSCINCHKCFSDGITFFMVL